MPRLPELCGNGSLYNLCQFPGGYDFFFLSCQHNVFGNVLCELVFSIVPDDAVQLSFGISVYNILGGKGLSSVHPHVKRSIKPVGKASFFCI